MNYTAPDSKATDMQVVKDGEETTLTKSYRAIKWTGKNLAEVRKFLDSIVIVKRFNKGTDGEYTKRYMYSATINRDNNFLYIQRISVGLMGNVNFCNSFDVAPDCYIFLDGNEVKTMLPFELKRFLCTTGDMA